MINNKYEKKYYYLHKICFANTNCTENNEIKQNYQDNARNTSHNLTRNKKTNIEYRSLIVSFGLTTFILIPAIYTKVRYSCTKILGRKICNHFIIFIFFL